MGHIAHLRKEFKSINTYDYIITLIKRRKKNKKKQVIRKAHLSFISGELKMFVFTIIETFRYRSMGCINTLNSNDDQYNVRGIRVVPF